MQQQLTIKLLPSEAASEETIKRHAAAYLAVSVESVTGLIEIKRSIDARGKTPQIVLTLLAFVNEPFIKRNISSLTLKDVSRAQHTVIIIGAGPAGLFAALKLIEQGIKPVILERGKDVRARRRDLAALNKDGEINPDSNYCFGEGGAGTYSDGKLYTRSTKRGDVNRILNIFVAFGADERILSDAHPHIGTNKLPAIIGKMRQQIESSGGECHFDKKVTGMSLINGKLTAVTCSDGDKFSANAFIFATGHSARDIFTLLYEHGLLIEAKPFALGVRVEHPQELIDSIQYHRSSRGEFLPPAAYSLVHQVNERGVFSFCMCPGGIIAPASTDPGELVVNGWSPSKRNNPFANSGIVVAVNSSDYAKLVPQYGQLAAMEFQRAVEISAYQHGGGKFVAPAQRLVDFSTGTTSSSLPDCSYVPGIAPAHLGDVLPPFIYASLQHAFREFGKKMRGYFTNEAVVVATESRTSSPVRIPREPTSMSHPQCSNLFPCGEGAGYAGGIVSAAMDGERVAGSIAEMMAAHALR